MTTQEEIDFLRATIRDYLVVTLDEGVIEIEKASQIARATLDLLPDNLTPEQVQKAVTELKQKFPEQIELIDAAVTACKAQKAKITVDQTIIPLIKQGNLDAALDEIHKIQLK